VNSTTAAVILTGGDPVPREVGDILPPGAFVIAADSGLHHAGTLGITVDLIVGDLDSADPVVVARTLEAGAHLERHPVDKDATDLELALDAAVARNLSPAIVVGGAGWDRIDHLLGNALVLADPRYRSLRPHWLVKGARVHVVHDHAVITGRPGDTLTLLAVGGPAGGVVTAGLRWPLAGDTLAPGSTRGISNELTGEQVTISVDSGTLLAVHIGAP